MMMMMAAAVYCFSPTSEVSDPEDLCTDRASRWVVVFWGGFTSPTIHLSNCFLTDSRVKLNHVSLLGGGRVSSEPAWTRTTVSRYSRLYVELTLQQYLSLKLQKPRVLGDASQPSRDQTLLLLLLLLLLSCLTLRDMSGA